MGVAPDFVLFVLLQVPFDPLELVAGRHAGGVEEGRVLALSICKAINFYIAPEAPGCEVGCGVPPIYLRILRHCATPEIRLALTRGVRRQDLTARVSGAPFERAVAVMVGELFNVAATEHLTVGAVVWLAGSLV
jgi:hypothetical protein